MDVEALAREVQEQLERGELDRVVWMLKRFDVAYLPDLLERLEPEYRPTIAQALPNEKIVQFIGKLSQELLQDFVKGLSVARIVKIASSLPSDELADLIFKLPAGVRRGVYRELPYWKLKEVRPLLQYPPETAGGLMSTRIPIFYKNVTIERALEEYTATLKFDRYDATNYLYVVDEKGKFLGWIKVTEGITFPKDKRLGALIRRPPTVHPNVDQEEVAKMVARYDLEEIPVVDENGKLLGTITADDVIDVIISEASEDMIKFGGTVKLEESYLTARVMSLVKKRALWIVILYLLESVTANVLKIFENELTSVVALSFFIPLLIDSGGNAGSQSATLVIRALALGEISIKDLFRVISRESITALGLGAILSPVGFGIAYTVTWNLKVATIVSLSIIFIVYMASLIGAILPFLAKLIKVDPAVVSAPLITTISDIIGLTLYFTLAMLIFFS